MGVTAPDASGSVISNHYLVGSPVPTSADFTTSLQPCRHPGCMSGQNCIGFPDDDLFAQASTAVGTCRTCLLLSVPRGDRLGHQAAWGQHGARTLSRVRHIDRDWNPQVLPVCRQWVAKKCHKGSACKFTHAHLDHLGRPTTRWIEFHPYFKQLSSSQQYAQRREFDHPSLELPAVFWPARTAAATDSSTGESEEPVSDVEFE